MSAKSPFAAAVVAAIAALGVSAAFQPAAASPIVIDDFTVVQSATASGGSGIPTVFATDTTQGGATFGPFAGRELYGNWASNTPRPSRTVGAISNGSFGQLQLTQTSTASGVTDAGEAYSYFGYDGGTGVNLTTSGTSFSITTLATSSTGDFRGYMEISTGGGAQSARYDLGTMWAPNTTTEIPFSAFTGVDFTQVDYLYVGIRNFGDFNASTINSATANFASISVVPEPTQMVSLAGIGLAYGAFRLRKLRRDRGTSEAAAV